MAYTSQALVKSYLGIPSASSSENTAVDSAIAAADSEIDQICGRTFVTPGAATTKTYVPYDNYTVYIDDVAQTSGLVVKEDTSLDGSYDNTLTITTDFIVSGNNAPYRILKRVDGDLWPRDRYGRPTVSVEAYHGYQMTVPSQISQCALVIAARLYQRKSSPLGFQTGGVDLGFVRISRNDPEVQSLLRGLKIMAAA